VGTKAKVTVSIENWDEQPCGDKLTRASVAQALSGDIEGEAAVEWLMCYRPDETAEFVGLQRVTGRLGEREGSFVLVHSGGTFDGTEAAAELAVVAGSGTDELKGLRGSGEFTAPHGGTPSLTLDYDFE
jgi:Protein of unknown function (DUF3224)